MNTKVLFLLGLVAAVAADNLPSYSYGPPQDNSFEYSSNESSEPAKYNFEFDVEDGYSGADFNHQEARDDDNTQGSYTVQLPDGRIQKVTYYVNGDSGYVAEVTYEGEAQYPESAESREYSAPRPSYSATKPKPTYSAPRPTYSAPEPREYSAPRPSYSAPKPKPTYSAPRPTYSAPESYESQESAFYSPPSRGYGVPQ